MVPKSTGAPDIFTARSWFTLPMLVIFITNDPSRGIVIVKLPFSSVTAATCSGFFPEDSKTWTFTKSIGSPVPLLTTLPVTVPLAHTIIGIAIIPRVIKLLTLIL